MLDIKAGIALGCIPAETRRMPHHHNPPDQHRAFARNMRKESTKAEEMLWQQLKNRQMEGRKFRRQVPLKGYVLDFVSFDAKLIIEVDGSQHAESQRDAVRDALLRTEGFRVIRFWNDEVEHSLDFVCRSIIAVLKDVGE